MNELHIAAIGLPPQDSLILRSTLRLLSSPAWRWVFVTDDEAADVVLVLSRHHPVPRAPRQGRRTDSRPSPLVVAVSYAGGPPHADGLGLALPLRARELAAPLAALAMRALERRRQHELGFAEASPAKLLDVLAGRPHRWVGRLPASLSFGADGRNDTLTIEQLDDAPPPANLRWRSSNAAALQALCHGVKNGEVLRIAFDAPVAGGASDDPPLGHGAQLVWALAAYDPRPSLPADVPAHARLSLRGWPDFGVLPVIASHVRVVALLNRRRFTLAEITTAGEVDEPEAIAVINACHALGLLEVEPQDAARPEASAADEVAAAVPALLTGRRLGDLVSNIRAALRGAVARRAP